jgi:formamidopyrimidine-DNA glycosylase
VPGLPEAEVLRRDLEKEVVGRRVKEAIVRSGRNCMKILPRHGRRKEFSDLLVGTKISTVGRVGKVLYLDLDNGHSLLVDLGTSGSLMKTSASEDMAAHTHVVIGFTIGGQLRIADPKLTADVYVAPRDELDKLRTGPGFALDPFAAQLTWRHFSALLAEHDVTLRELLLDDRFICGLGPIYSDEILFASGIRHDRRSNHLGAQDVRRLYRGLMETMQDALRARGTTYGEHHFRDLHGSPGQYQIEFKVFERTGEACRRCRHAVVEEETNGGITYYCPQCQT